MNYYNNRRLRSEINLLDTPRGPKRLVFWGTNMG
jgi:hypothetical protein